MSKKRLVTMGSGTILSALAIGFFMQRAETASPRHLVPTSSSQIQQVVLKPVVSVSPNVANAALILPDLATQPVIQTLVSASAVVPTLMPPSNSEAGLGFAALTEGTALPADPAIPRLGCDVTATAVPVAKAMVDLNISAPCFINERLTIHHNGMMFTQSTDELGNLSISVPALSEHAVFIIAFADGKGTVALTNVPTLRNYERVVIQWTGNTGFQMHAREFGASYGEPGHVWSGVAPGDLESVGFVTRLGDAETLAPQMAEIYTFPSGSTSMSGVVALSVEAEVTQANCGRDISAQSLELRGSSSLRTRALVMAMPNCSDLGDFLVLNNLVDDLKIAAR